MALSMRMPCQWIVVGWGRRFPARRAPYRPGVALSTDRAPAVETPDRGSGSPPAAAVRCPDVRAARGRRPTACAAGPQGDTAQAPPRRPGNLPAVQGAAAVMTDGHQALPDWLRCSDDRTGTRGKTKGSAAGCRSRVTRPGRSSFSAVCGPTTRTGSRRTTRTTESFWNRPRTSSPPARRCGISRRRSKPSPRVRVALPDQPGHPVQPRQDALQGPPGHLVLEGDRKTAVSGFFVRNCRPCRRWARAATASMPHG